MDGGTKVKAEHFILAALFIGAAVYYWNARTGVFVQPQQPQAVEKHTPVSQMAMTDDDPAPFGLKAEIVKTPAVGDGLYRYYCNITNSANTHWSGLVRVELLDNGGGAVAGQKTQLQIPAGASKFVTVDFHRPGLTRVRLTVPE